MFIIHGTIGAFRQNIINIYTEFCIVLIICREKKTERLNASENKKKKKRKENE